MIQIIELTHAQKVKMYMKLPKKEIIEMLIECGRVLETITPYISDHQFTLSNPPPNNLKPEKGKLKSSR